jgi:hypothetical protein
VDDLLSDDIVVPPDADVEALKKEIGVWYTDPFFVRLGSDSGGKHLELFIEREDPTDRLEPWMLEALPGYSYRGWRLLVIKCPPHYIKVFLLHKK